MSLAWFQTLSFMGMISQGPILGLWCQVHKSLLVTCGNTA